MNPPETHFDKKLIGGTLVFFVSVLMAYVLISKSPSDIVIGAFTTWIGGLLGVLGNIVTGRPSSRANDKGTTLTTEAGTTSTITAEVKNP